MWTNRMMPPSLENIPKNMMKEYTKNIPFSDWVVWVPSQHPCQHLQNFHLFDKVNKTCFWEHTMSISCKTSCTGFKMTRTMHSFRFHTILMTIIFEHNFEHLIRRPEVFTSATKVCHRQVGHAGSNLPSFHRFFRSVAKEE